MSGSAEPAARRRQRWIACSLRHQVRPLLWAGIVCARGGEPPELPLAAGELARCGALRPSDRKLLGAHDSEAERVAAVESRARRLGCEILTPEDPGWQPLLWRELDDPPPALYVRGDLHAPDAPAVAIVGTRHPSGNGLQLARSIARDLAAEGIVIVSGLALGIDGAAHRGALDVGRQTVAVLGGGIDRPSPPSHRTLAEGVARSGALVSEFPPGVDPRPLHFPRRNRLIAALAQILLVVEGGRRSGARSTVDHALSLGREVVAIPRDPLHEGSALPNALLRSGAVAITRAADLLEILEDLALRTGRPELPGRPGVPDRSAGAFLTASETSVLDALGRSGSTVEQIGRRLQRPSQEILSSLGRLELTGRVRRCAGLRFERTAAAR